MKKIIILIAFILIGISSFSQRYVPIGYDVMYLGKVLFSDTAKINKSMLFMNGINYAGFKYTGSVKKIYTLPATDGTNGQVLSTNGSGVMSWATAGGGVDTSLIPFLGTQNAWTKYNSFAGTTLFSGAVLFDGNIGSALVNPDTIYAATTIVNGVKSIHYSTSVIDDQTIVFPNTINSGWGTINIDSSGICLANIQVRWDSDGTTYVISSSKKSYISVVNTDTDVKLCFFDNGTSPALRNRLGYTTKAIITTWH